MPRPLFERPPLSAAEIEARAAEERTRKERAYHDALTSSVALLNPIASHWRPFHAQLAQHSVALAQRHSVMIQIVAMSRTSANVSTRTVFTPPITNEYTYARFLHEFAHVVEPMADARQHRYIETATTRVCPLAECAAWDWARRHAYKGYWTQTMNEELTRCLATYRSHATRDELDVITATVAAGFEAVRPAPDTPEGRREIAAAIEREMRWRKRWPNAPVW